MEYKEYQVWEQIGNFADVVFTGTFNECQDYLEDRLLERTDIDPTNEAEVELFYSYFGLEEIKEESK